ncbi:MAG: ribonuclease III [Gammaproteobacteria bacterium]|nr:ribonuclease III [Gammaproteobacteria bacterium]
MSVNQLEKKISYIFKDPQLLDIALRHRSVGHNSNERLEFLGDAILNFVIAAELFNRYPAYREGDLSRLRSNLVRRETLAEIAQDFDIGEFLHLGVGERKSGGFRRSSILADAVEAIIGAIFQDSDVETCGKVIIKWYENRLKNLTVDHIKDAKTELQEYMQAQKLPLPKYEIIATSGKSHHQVFSVRCSEEGLDIITEADGPSRKKAEQDAAEKFLEQLQEQKKKK